MQVEINSLISLFGVLLTLGGFVALWAGVISKMRTQLDLLWEIYITDTLKAQRQRGAIESSSPDKLTPKAWKSVRPVLDMKVVETIRTLVKNNRLPATDGALSAWYVERVGLQAATTRADAQDITLSAYLVGCVVYLRELERGEDSLKETLGV